MGDAGVHLEDQFGIHKSGRGRPTIDTNNRDKGRPAIKELELERARFKAEGDLALWRRRKL